MLAAGCWHTAFRIGWWCFLNAPIRAVMERKCRSVCLPEPPQWVRRLDPSCSAHGLVSTEPATDIYKRPTKTLSGFCPTHWFSRFPDLLIGMGIFHIFQEYGTLMLWKTYFFIKKYNFCLSTIIGNHRSSGGKQQHILYVWRHIELIEEYIYVLLNLLHSSVNPKINFYHKKKKNLQLIPPHPF